MSRIGKKQILLPDKVNIKIELGRVLVEGPKGKLNWLLPEGIEVRIDESHVLIKRLNEDKKCYAIHGLVRSYIGNMIKGVTEGYMKSLEIHGVGYRAQVDGNILKLQLGFSHPILYPIPEGVTIKTVKQNQIIVEGIDKTLVGEVAAEVRDYFRPEPYKGKGIRYTGEYVRKKAGKSVA